MNSAETGNNDWREVIVGRPEQREAIYSDATLTVVSAGAGTGKTHTLAQRFAWLLASDPDCGVDEILVMTFTEKAAREMRERIKSTVEKWFAAYPRELPHLKRSVRYMDDAAISTIHAFAMKVIRESALELDVDPTASIIPAPKEDLWWESLSSALGSLTPKPLLRLLDDTWKDRAEQLFSEPEFAAFISLYTPENLSKAARRSGDVLGSIGKSPEDLWNQTSENLLLDVSSMGDYMRSVMELWMTRVLPEIAPEQRDKPETTLRRLVEILLQYSELEIDENNSREFCRLLFKEGLAKLPPSGKVKTAVTHALAEPLKEWRDREVRNYFKAKLPTEEEQFIAGLLNRTCALGWQCWDALRLREGTLSMNDLIRYAGEVLEKSPSYGGRYRHILVDEFQDTDRLQDRLLTSLWREGENTLFLVGDLKQSIYRFRHADLHIFQSYILKARNDTSGRYRYITLDRSYRTKGGLLSSFNDIFSGLWADGLEKGSSMTYEPLRGPDDEEWWSERNSPELLPLFETYLSATGNMPEEALEREEKDNVTGARLTLFRGLANSIADIYARKDKVWGISDGKPGHREVCWRDFAVLVPARGVYPLVERAFGEIGVPYVLSASKSYFSRGDVADVTALISLLADPENPTHLAGWISSPLSGASYLDAARCLEEALSQKKKMEQLPLADIVKVWLPEVWENIMRLRKLALLRGVSFAILDLLRRPFFLYFYEPRQRRSVVANLIRLSQAAGEYESSEGASLTGFADYLQMISLSDGHTEEPDVTDEDEDAVRVLTIHSSKGLEYPIVAVLCGDIKGGKSDNIIISPRYGIAPKKLPAFLKVDTGENGKKEADTVTSLWHRDSEKEKGAAEHERLYYVALTRARDKLFLCDTGRYDKEAGECKRDSFAPFMREVLDTVYSDSSATLKYLRYHEQPKSLRVCGEQAEQSSEALELPEIYPAKLGRLSASAYAMLAWCPLAYRIAYRQGRSMAWMVTGDGAGADADQEEGGADFGSLAHWILSRWDFDAETLDIWLPHTETEAYSETRRALPPYLREIFSKEAVRDELREMLSRYAGGDEGRKLARLAAKDGLEREVSFNVPDEGLSLIGSVDIMWEEGDALHIRDWKTASESVAPVGYYEAQLNFYAYAVYRFRKNRGLPERDIKIALNYLRPDESTSCAYHVAVTELEGIGRDVHKAAELALSGEFKQETAKCENCPWKKFCVAKIW